MNSVHEGQKNHKCDLCNKAFSENRDLKKHIKCVHEGLKNHKCDICDKAFSEPWKLKRHILTVHEGLIGEFYEKFVHKRAPLVNYLLQNVILFALNSWHCF